MRTKNKLPVMLMLIAALITITACSRQPGEHMKKQSSQSSEKQSVALQEQTDDKKEDQQLPESLIHSEGGTLQERVQVPDGYARTSEAEDSLGAFLRSYPMEADGSPVRLYNGKKKGNQQAHAAVFSLPIEDVDLQQCADSVMRVYAEYFRKSGQEDRIAFHFVDGFICDYPTWKSGKRVSFSDEKPVWVSKGGSDDSDESFIKYMHMVFSYASTLSMDAYETEPGSMQELQIGDVFLKGGSPGHVCMVVDLCEKDGKKAFLLAQGFMPAQQFHLLKNPLHEEDPWYYEDEVTYPFQTPEYTFEEGSLRHMNY